jgi:hypothetical protein
MTSRPIACLLFAALLLPSPARPDEPEPVDLQMVTRIRDEGFHRSQVMETVTHLTEVIGPRLTGSPQMKEANDWTRKKLAEWGLTDAHLEPWSFGRGWSYSRVAVHMVKPHQEVLFALPKGWTPGTHGAVRAPVVRVDIESEKDVETYRGKLAGKIVLRDAVRDLAQRIPDDPRRYDDKSLDELIEFELPNEIEQSRADRMKRRLDRDKTQRLINEFLVAEGVVASFEVSNRSWGVIRVGRSASWHADESPGVPTLMMAAEAYNHMVRLVDRGEAVELEVELQARFHDDDPMAYNTVAEIAGTDRKGEVVMAGAHLDSWHAAGGATDDAAGCAVVMEAVRILQTLGVKPRRTIRVGLWSGEEEGLLGSSAYVYQHLATRPVPEDPAAKRASTSLWTGSLTLKPGHAKLSAYFNLDNGAGKIRGVYTEENAAVAPIFAAWLAPLRDLGAGTVTLRETGQTDHVAFTGVGIPGFQFIQDELDYSARTHHSNMDTFDHLEPQDLMQASVVLASFLYHAAMRPEPLPRAPMPRE